MDAKIQHAAEACTAVLVELESLFTKDCRLTLVMRSTTNEKCFLVLSADDLNEVVEKVFFLKKTDPNEVRTNKLRKAYRDARAWVEVGHDFDIRLVRIAAPKAVSIVMNGRRMLAQPNEDGIFSYADIVELAGLREGATVTFRLRSGSGCTLGPGEAMRVSDGTIFNVADTSSA